MLLGLTFLAPLAGLIALGVGAPLLALLYFLRLRRRPMRISSTLLWERSARDLQVNAPWRLLRLSFLLLLHTLALLLLVGAIARPAIPGEDSSVARVIILIDRSASMSARDVVIDDRVVSRLEDARSAASKYLRSLPSESEAMVISFAADVTTEINFTRNRGAALAAIEGVIATDLPGDLGAAMRVVAAFVSGDAPDADGLGARVALFADGSYDDNGEGSGLPENAELVFFRTGPDPGSPRNNIGIVALAARRDTEAPSVMRVFARLLNAGTETVRTTVTCSVDSEGVESRTIDVPGRSEAGADVSVSFEVTLAGASLVRVSTSADDDLASDDDAACTVGDARGARVLLVRPRGEPDEASQHLEFAIRTLEPESLRIVDPDDAGENPGANGVADLVFFDRTHSEGIPGAPSVSFGDAPPVPGLLFEPADGSREGQRIVFWKRTHPLLRYVSLGDTPIGRAGRLRLASVDSDDGRTRSETLATGPDGALIALVEHRSVRHVVVAFSLNTSFWWREGGFPIFVSNAFTYLTSGDLAPIGRFARAGENVSVRSASGSLMVRVRGPIDLDRKVSAGNPVVSLGVLSRVGVYGVEGVVPGDEVLSVNLLNETETALATTDAPDLPGGTGAEARAAESANIRELWAWCIGIALILLTIEWIVYARGVRL